jgi:hypothetical protein
VYDIAELSELVSPRSIRDRLTLLSDAYDIIADLHQRLRNALDTGTIDSQENNEGDSVGDEPRDSDAEPGDMVSSVILSLEET